MCPDTARSDAVFLDRDGVINARPKNRYITRWEEFRFLPGALPALRRLAEARRRVILVSNQAGVGRGLLSRRRLEEITRRMRLAIRAAGGRLDAVYYCTHTPSDGCGCRKPKPGMLHRARRRFGIRLQDCWLVGDHPKDMEMGRFAGCRTVLVLGGETNRSAARRMRIPPDHIAQDLHEAVHWILRQ